MIFVIFILLFIILDWKFIKKRLTKANHSKGWDAKLLAYVPQGRDRVAGLPGVSRLSP